MPSSPKIWKTSQLRRKTSRNNHQDSRYLRNVFTQTICSNRQLLTKSLPKWPRYRLTPRILIFSKPRKSVASSWAAKKLIHPLLRTKKIPIHLFWTRRIFKSGNPWLVAESMCSHEICLNHSCRTSNSENWSAGTFGKVFLVQNKFNQQLYAMKCIRKDVILENE